MGKVTYGENIGIEMKPLAKGTYAYEFIITDVFGQEIITLYVPFSRGGHKADFRVVDTNEMRQKLYMDYGMSL